LSRTAFRRMLSQSPSLPENARLPLTRYLEASSCQESWQARREAAQVLIALTGLKDLDIAPLVDLDEDEIRGLRG